MPPARRNPPKDSLAGAAGDRVRAIIEAAESSAAEIRAEAEAEAERIRARAEDSANALQSEIRGDVQALLGSIRGAVDRLSSDLERLQERLGEPESGPVAGSEPVGAPVEEDLDLALSEDAAVGPSETETAPTAAGVRSTGGSVGGADLEGARLVALNMALDGASREEVGRHLRESHGLSEPEGMLDEVYESIGRS